MTAIRASAPRAVTPPTRAGLRGRLSGAANPAGSRARAISAARFCGVGVVSSQRQAGADHIGADQRQQPGGDRPGRPRRWPGASGRPPAGPGTLSSQPAAVLASAAGLPSLLPGGTGLGLQPVQHDADPAAPVLLAGRPATTTAPRPAARPDRRAPAGSAARRPGPGAAGTAAAARQPGRPAARCRAGAVPRPSAGPVRRSPLARPEQHIQRLGPVARSGRLRWRWPAARRAADGRPARRRSRPPAAATSTARWWTGGRDPGPTARRCYLELSRQPWL